MRPILKFDVVVTMDRNAALTAAADALNGAGGWIVDHSLFSDVMAVIRFALPGDRVSDFGRRLAASGLILDPAATDAPSSDEVAGLLTLTFAQGTGDLKRDVPAFH
jgi:hypothetical protein